MSDLLFWSKAVPYLALATKSENMPISEQPDDETLMVKMANGDSLAAKCFVTRHMSYVLRVCQQKLGSREQAEEAAQEVFVAVWKFASSWQPNQAKVTTWLYRIAVNKSIDVLRRTKETADINDFHNLASDAPHADKELFYADDKRLLASAIESLSPQQQKAIALIYFEDVKQAEAAAEMSISLAAFESILRRARQALHAELAKQRPLLTSI